MVDTSLNPRAADLDTSANRVEKRAGDSAMQREAQQFNASGRTASAASGGNGHAGGARGGATQSNVVERAGGKGEG